MIKTIYKDCSLRQKDTYTWFTSLHLFNTQFVFRHITSYSFHRKGYFGLQLDFFYQSIYYVLLQGYVCLYNLLFVCAQKSALWKTAFYSKLY